MIYVILNDKAGTILNRCDAWKSNGYEEMTVWAVANRYNIVDEKITAMGDMLILVEGGTL